MRLTCFLPLRLFFFFFFFFFAEVRATGGAGFTSATARPGVDDDRVPLLYRAIGAHPPAEGQHFAADLVI